MQETVAEDVVVREREARPGSELLLAASVAVASK
jgi:hypothetical protein